MSLHLYDAWISIMTLVYIIGKFPRHNVVILIQASYKSSEPDILYMVRYGNIKLALSGAKQSLYAQRKEKHTLGPRIDSVTISTAYEYVLVANMRQTIYGLL